MKTDVQHVEEMDLGWLMANGWTVHSNLVFRRCLEYVTTNRTPPPSEFIERLLLDYGIDGDSVHATKIKDALREYIETAKTLKNIFSPSRT